MTQPSAAASAGFLAIVASLFVLVPVAVRQAEHALGADPARARRRALLAVVVASAWLAATAAFAFSGALRDFDARPPRLALIVAPPLLACLILTLTSAGRRLATGLPAALLIGFQAFRVPVELILHRLHGEGVLPVQMTFEGRNLDIATGLTAIPVAWLALRGRLPRWAFVLWNVAGLALLANIMVIATLSTPYSFRRFLEGPANEAVFSWPFVWLPAFVVPAALLGHLLALRKAAEPTGRGATTDGHR